MNATRRLNSLLSDLLQSDSPSTINTNLNFPMSKSDVPSLKFDEYYSKPRTNRSASNNRQQTAPSRRNSFGFNHDHVHLSNDDNKSDVLPPLLNSSTLDDLFRALTLECEQYLATANRFISNAKQVDDPLPIPSLRIEKPRRNSNNEDYENLQRPISNTANNIGKTLKTHIEVIRPEKKQIVSTKISSSSVVPASQTFPLLMSSVSTRGKRNVPSYVCRSSDDDSLDVSSTYVNNNNNRRRRRRRFTRRSNPTVSINHSSSSENEFDQTTTETSKERKISLPKRSASNIDHQRTSRTKLMSNKTRPVLSSSTTSAATTTFNYLNKFPRRRDVSLPQTTESATNEALHRNRFSPFPAEIYSPISVLLNSSRRNSDFIDQNCQENMFERSKMRSQQRYNENKQNDHHIPTHRIAPFPVY